MFQSRLVLRPLQSLAAASAVLPRDYSNLPYKKAEKLPKDGKRNCIPHPSHNPIPSPAGRAPLPAPLRSNYIDRSPFDRHSNINNNSSIKSFRRAMCRSSDVSMRPMLFYAADGVTENVKESVAQHPARNYGEKVQEVSCRWAAKFYGNVTYGPRNYPYPSSRWLARRFRMKKHRIIKRFRFRRYKLAAVANLPFAKMIRVGMLPELKSSKTKKGDTLDAGLTQQLVGAAKGATGAKTAGRRRRPKSKYQV